MRPGIVETHLLKKMSYMDCEAGCLMEGYRGCIKGVCPLSPEQGASCTTAVTHETDDHCCVTVVVAEATMRNSAVVQ